MIRTSRVTAMTIAAAAALALAAGCGSKDAPVAASTAAAGSVTAGAPAADPPAPVSGTTPSTPSAAPVRLVVIGDSVPFAAFCPGCTGFVDRYAKELEARTGRPVDVANRSRDDTAGLPEIRTQLTDDANLRGEVAAADVVLVSVGFNNALPDPTTGVGCGGDLGSGVEGYISWALSTKEPCLRAGIATYAEDYDEIFSTIVQLRKGAPGLLAALNVYDANLDSADFAGAPVSDVTRAKIGRWMVRAYDRWNAMVRARARHQGLVYVDLYHAFNGRRGTAPAAPLLVDGSHPSQEGNDRIAALLAKLDSSAIAAP